MNRDRCIQELLGGYLDNALLPEQDQALARLAKKDRAVVKRLRELLVLDNLPDQLMNKEPTPESFLAPGKGE